MTRGLPVGSIVHFDGFLNALAVLIAVALGACAPQQPPASGDTAPGSEALPRFIGVVGTRAQHDPPFLGVPGTNFYCLRSFVDRQTGETRHQLYVSDSYTGAEREWNAARDGAGRPLRFIEVGRHKITCDGGCSYVEEFAANIPDSELRANPRGLSVTFAARSGAQMTIPVSAGQIAAQLAEVDARRSPAAAAAHQ